MSTTSRLFEGYRSLGIVSSEVPLLLRYVERLNKIQVITAVGRSFLVFNQRLQLVETCVAHNDDIVALAADSRLLFTASKNEIFAWKYGHKWKVKSYVRDRAATIERGSFTHLMPFGAQLIAVDRSNTLYAWDIESQQLSLTLQLSVEEITLDDDQQPQQTPQRHSFEITALLHPATYINKILLGSRSGELQLWNLAKQKMIYRFDGWRSPVTAMEQAPALHIAAIGHESGLIVLHHLNADETLMKFRQEWGPVSGITFRTDDAATIPIMITSCSSNGHLAIWNLDERRLETQMRDAHFGAIVGARFVSKQPLLVTNSSANSLKIFVFDDLAIGGRALYQREGHRAPPTRIRFYGDRGHYVMSAGLDSSLRAFFIYSERKNRSLGVASYNRRQAKKKGVDRDTAMMRPIVEFAFETTREKQWANVIAVHRDTPFVTTWSFDRMTMGEHRLTMSGNDSSSARKSNISRPECVSMSFCGNFALVGYASGHVERFNVQSALHRCSYGDYDDENENSNNGHKRAHRGIVRGVQSDALNRLVVSGGADFRLRFWRFARGEPIGTLSLNGAVNRMILHAENGLLAVSLDNYHIVIVDLETKRIVRRFTAHRARVTDLAFDADCRRLFVSAIDSRIYVWCMITGSLVDVFRTATPCVSLTLSPSGEFLATAHVDDLAIYLWTNRAIYQPISLPPIAADAVDRHSAQVITLPAIRSDEEEADEDAEADEESDETMQESDTIEAAMDYEYRSPEQLSSELITLSSLPSSRWKNLLALDVIRRRNKPTQTAIQRPSVAPFFLPTISGLTPKFDIEPSKDGDQNVTNPLPQQPEDNEKRVAAAKNKFRLQFMSPFIALLDRCETVSPGDGTAIGVDAEQSLHASFAELKSYGPSKIDAEIRTLSRDATDGTTRYLHLFLDMIGCELRANRDFELAQSYLALFLAVHLDTIASDRELAQKCATLGGVAERSWITLRDDFDRSLCLINYLRNALL